MLRRPLHSTGKHRSERSFFFLDCNLKCNHFMSLFLLKISNYYSLNLEKWRKCPGTKMPCWCQGSEVAVDRLSGGAEGARTQQLFIPEVYLLVGASHDGGPRWHVSIHAFCMWSERLLIHTHPENTILFFASLCYVCARVCVWVCSHLPNPIQVFIIYVQQIFVVFV